MGNAATKDGTHRSFNEINHHHNEHPHPHKRRNSKDGGEVVDDDTGSQVQASWKLEHARDVLHAGNDLFKEQKFNEAKKRYAEAIETLQHGAGSSRSHDNHVAGLSNLGVMEFAEGRYEEAKRLLQEALNHRREYLGQNDSKQTSNISSLYIALKKDKEYHHRASIDLGHDASHLIEHSTVDGLTAELLHNLAACHQKTGDLETAKKLYEECLQLRKVVHGERSLKVADALHCIATILDKQGHPVAAGEALHEALLIEEEQHGADALDTAMTMNNLGVLCVHARDYQKGLVYLERAHTVRLQQLGAAHHLTELTARNIHQCREAMHSAAYADDNNSSS